MTNARRNDRACPDARAGGCRPDDTSAAPDPPNKPAPPTDLKPTDLEFVEYFEDPFSPDGLPCRMKLKLTTKNGGAGFFQTFDVFAQPIARGKGSSTPWFGVGAFATVVGLKTFGTAETIVTVAAKGAPFSCSYLFGKVYWFKAIVDTGLDVRESKESNNDRIISIKLKDPDAPGRET